MSLEAHHVLDRSRSTAWQRVGGELVVLDLDGRKIMGLNETAALLWELADGKNSVADMAKALVESFQVAHKQAVEDVKAFMSYLLERGLVEVGAEKGRGNGNGEVRAKG